MTEAHFAAAVVFAGLPMAGIGVVLLLAIRAIEGRRLRRYLR